MESFLFTSIVFALIFLGVGVGAMIQSITQRAIDRSHKEIIEHLCGIHDKIAQVESDIHHISELSHEHETETWNNITEELNVAEKLLIPQGSTRKDSEWY